eukprot:bmy_14864T0
MPARSCVLPQRSLILFVVPVNPPFSCASPCAVIYNLPLLSGLTGSSGVTALAARTASTSQSQQHDGTPQSVQAVIELMPCNCSLLCHRDTQAAPGPRSEWETSLREEFLGHSHCCPIPWIPRDNKVDKAGAPQHGRINAENEPSPRHGAHGARPTGARELADPGPILTVLTQFHIPPHHPAPTWDPLVVAAPQEHPSCLVLQ